MGTAGVGPWPHLGYTGARLDRVSAQRGAAAALLAASDARTILISGDSVILRRCAGGHDALFARQEASDLGADLENACLLGVVDKTPHLAVPVSSEALAGLGTRDDLHVIDLRTIAVDALVPADQIGELACGKALLAWHARRTYCSNCAGRLVVAEAGWRRECPGCGALHFPRTDPVVIMLTVDGDECLMGRSERFAPGMWSCLAGFVEPGETLEQAARRETWEETAIRTGEARYLCSQPWPFPMSVMVGFHLQASSRDITIDPVEIEAARWFSREEAALMLSRTHPDGLIAPPPMAIAHHLIKAFVEGRDPPPQ